jgi:hypothetical protein
MCIPAVFIAGSTNVAFQSTLPTRGATGTSGFPCHCGISSVAQFQSTLPTRGATCVRRDSVSPSPSAFQSTLPTRGATMPPAWIRASCVASFQSTLPTRGATMAAARCIPYAWLVSFNPRSPHGERRRGLLEITRSRSLRFNPRSPHGERLTAGMADIAFG